MADNSTQGGADTIRDKDRAGVKTQIFGVDLNIGGGSEVLQTAAALADATANPTVPAWAALGMLYNGTTWDRMRGDTTNGVDVDVTRLPALPAGTNNIGDVDVLTLPSLPAGAAIIGKVDINTAPAFTLGAGAATVGTVLNVGDVDHDAANTAKVVQTGGHASYPAVPTSVSADGDRVRQWQDRAGAQIVRKRPVAMYTAQYRLANATAGNRLLLATLTANTNKQVATIYHAAGSTKRVQIKLVSVNFSQVGGVAAIHEWELVTLSATTAPATGNPAITPAKNDQADAAAEATCLSLPTTQGSVVNADQPVGDNYAQTVGITGAGSTANPPPPATRVILWDSRDMGDGKDLIMRAATAEGYAVVVRSQGASNVSFTVTTIFTEES